MAGDAIFYVYEHWRPDTAKCFYVGKGKLSRAHIMRERNSHHSRIVAKLVRLDLSVDVRVIGKDLSEPDAFSLEKERITHWRTLGDDLCNMTDGGDGTSGWVHTEDARRRMSDAQWGNKKGLGNRGKHHTDDARRRISEFHKGKPKPHGFGDKLAARMRGSALTDDVKKKISETLSGRKLPPEVVAKISLGLIGNKFAKANIGRKHTREARSNMSRGCLEREARKREIRNASSPYGA